MDSRFYVKKHIIFNFSFKISSFIIYILQQMAFWDFLVTYV